ncbi:MAG: hypothetical protein FWF67_01695 [Fibromonadales bacterium]|nr:hypothetical protein [Fibromonadales bacterium]
MEPTRKTEMLNALDALYKNEAFAGKDVFVFGHCNATEEMIDYLSELSVNVTAILDNNKTKIGNSCKGVPIILPQYINANGIVLIANRFYEQMAQQLREIGCEGRIVKVLEYNSYAEYSLSQETIKRKIGRMLRGKNTLEKIRAKHPKEHLVVCPHNALGDVYWAMSFLPAYVAKHKIDNVVVIVNGDACKQVAEMFVDTSCVLSLPNTEMEEFTQALIYCKEPNCIIAHHDKIYTDNSIKYLNSHFISFIDFYKYMVLGLDKTAEPVAPRFHLPFKNTAGILQGKTLIISPNAKSVVLPPSEFWQKTIQEYKSKGFMVCTSVVESETPLENTVPISFPLNQAISAVEYAGHFMGIRSGLCDVINSTKCNKTVVFPDCIYSTTKIKVADFFALPNWFTIFTDIV